MCAWIKYDIAVSPSLTTCVGRVYKNYDPRATIMKTVVEDVFEITGKDPLLDVAVELERIARSDDFFVKRKLYPNVDFYSGKPAHALRDAEASARALLPM